MFIIYSVALVVVGTLFIVGLRFNDNLVRFEDKIFARITGRNCEKNSERDVKLQVVEKEPVVMTTDKCEDYFAFRYIA